MRKVTLKDIWEEHFKGLFAYTTFRNYIKQNEDKFSEVMLIKRNKERTTYRVIDVNKFLKIFDEIL